MGTKVHRTVQLTAQSLVTLGCCREGVDEVASMLPADVSTDPEQNIALAEALAELDKAYYPQDVAGISSLVWCASQYGKGGVDDLDVYCVGGARSRSGQRPYGTDIGIIAQGLAMAADRILTREGK